jgi:hypothetical protein
VSGKAGVAPPPQGLHPPSLLPALSILAVGTFYPPRLLRHLSRSDHLFLTLLLCVISVGFVRSVGLVPVPILRRWVLWGWRCALPLLLARVVRVLH